MYGGQFAQAFGWYIQQTYLRIGVLPHTFKYLEGRCPDHLKKQIDELLLARSTYDLEQARVMEIVRGPERSDIDGTEATYWRNLRREEAAPMLLLKKRRDRLERDLANSIENFTRAEFGFRKVGEGWVSETLLLQIVARVLSGPEIVHHHRPEWLDGLELDIFVPALRLGIEYQGQQHFHPVRAWGGEVGLRSLQERDERKRRKCLNEGVTLVEFDYTEPLTEEHVRSRLREVLLNLR